MEKLKHIKLNKILFLAIIILLIGCIGVLSYVIIPFTSVAYNEPIAKLDVSLSKYVNYDEQWGKGTTLQLNVKTGIEYDESQQYSPIRSAITTLTAPQIEGNYPEKVVVIPVSTKATNGKESNIENNYTYDVATGNITISATNEDENGNAIYTQNDAQAVDEYEVICQYGEATYNGENVLRELLINAKVTENLYNDENNIAEQSKTFKAEVTENVGTTTSVKQDTQDIYNGYIKSNIINGTQYGTEFKQTDEIIVSNKEAQQKIELVENNTFVQINKNQAGEEITQELGNNGNLKIKSTKIKKEEMVSLLGEEGTIWILDANNNPITEINKETQFSEDGTFTINYENELEGICIKTSQVQNEGILHIENTKEIKHTMLSAENVKVKVTNQIAGINEKTSKVQEKQEDGSFTEKEVITEEQVFSFNNENIVEIKDATTNVSLDVSLDELTNERQNEVTFEVKLQANSIKDNMFKNPTVKIDLPSEVEKVILGESSIMYANGLELQNPYTETNENGNIVIVANLSGVQTEYNQSELGLTTSINIQATLILKKDIENKSENINLIYTNGYTINGNADTGSVSKEVQIKSYQAVPETVEQNVAMYTDAQVTEQNIDGIKLEVAPVKGNTNLLDGNTVYENEYIKYNIKVTNTTDKKIDNVKVIGAIPEGVTYGELDTDYTVRFSKYEYNFDETVREKSIEIGTLEAGKTYEGYYEVKVNKLADGESQKEIATSISAYVGDTLAKTYEMTNTVKPAEVSVFVKAFMDNGDNRWDYLLTVEGEKDVTISFETSPAWELSHIVNGSDDLDVGKNIEEEETEEVEEEHEHENNNMPWESDRYSIDGNTITFTASPGKYVIGGQVYSNRVTDATDDAKALLTAVATATTENGEYKSNESRIVFEYENVSVSMTSASEAEEITSGDEINYEIVIKNIGSVNQNNSNNSYTMVNLVDYLPSNVTPVSVTYENYKTEIQTETYVDEQTGQETEVQKEVVAEKTTQVQGIINSTDKNGNALPEVNLKSLKIPYGESITVSVKAKAKTVEEKTQIENSATVTGDSIVSKTSNKVTHTIVPQKAEEPDNPDNPDDPNNPDNPDNPVTPDNPDDPNDPNNPTEEGNFKISGLVWNDANEDGQRQNSENTISGVTVMLVDTSNSEEVKAKTQTGNSGEYSFSNLETGNYIVVFRYDTGEYSLTKYQASGVSSTVNSDASAQDIILEDKIEKVGLTDIMEITGSVSNIDCGLVKNKICDLKLDKYITKVSVQTSKGTKTKEYSNEKLAKTEIRAKEIEGATVVTEYKIVVTNEGEAEATLGKVTDYMPEGFEFSSELNTNWAKQSNGELINSSMANKPIAAGESVELSLVLTKNMTSSSTGTFVNAAEITGMENSNNLKDIDSTPGNKVTTEDDYSEAELIISVSTGVAFYISIVFAIVAILAIICRLIYKYGAKEISKITLCGMVIFVSIFAAGFESEADVNSQGWEYEVVIEPGSGNWDFTPEVEPIHEIRVNKTRTSFSWCGCCTGTKKHYETRYRWVNTSHWVYEYDDFGNVTDRKWVNSGYYQSYKVQVPCPYGHDNGAGCAFFYGSDSNGWCASFGASAYSGGYTINQNSIPTQIVDEGYNNGEEKLDLVKTSGEPVEMLRMGNGESYIYGPMSFTSNKTTTNCPYNVTITVGGASRAAQPCDASGNPIELTGSGTFYIKLSRDEAMQGLTNVKVDGYDDRIYHWTERKYGAPMCYPDGGGQTVSSSSSYLVYEEYKEKLEWNYDEIEWTTFNTSIEVIKQDKDDHSVKLEDVEITVSGPSSKSDKTRGQYDTDGEIGTAYFDNLLAGGYEVTETFNPNYGYHIMETGETSTSNGQLVIFELDNEKQTGNLIIEKTDTDSGQKLAGIEFKLKYAGVEGVWSSPGHYINADGQYAQVLQGPRYDSLSPISSATGYVHVDGMEASSTGTTFITDSNGRIEIKNILVGSYEIEEVSVGNNYYGYTEEANRENVDGDYVLWNGSIIGKSTTVGVSRQTSPNTKDGSGGPADSVTVSDRKKYVRVTGMVWEDIKGGKDSVYDHEYHSSGYTGQDGQEYDGSDILLQGITVRIKQGDSVVQETVTDASGAYLFDDVLLGGYVNANMTNVTGIASYYIEFEYDGEIYTSTKAFNEIGYSNLNAPTTTSKALEVSSQRTKVDESYGNVAGTTTSTQSQVSGTSGEFAVNYNLTQGSDTTEASAKSKNVEIFESQLNAGARVRNVDQFSSYENYGINKLTSNTQETGYNVLGGSDSGTSDGSMRYPAANNVEQVSNGVETIESIRKTGVIELAHRDCGLIEREQVDLSITTDIDNVVAIVNGYSNTYKYGVSNSYNNDAIGMENFRLDVKAKTVQGYKRPMYRSDIVYDILEYQDTTQIYIISKISMNNNSTTLSASVTEVTSYYDARCDIVASGTSNVLENGSYEIAWTEEPTYAQDNNGYAGKHTTNLSDVMGIIPAGQTKTFYVKYKLSNEAVRSVLTNDVTLNNVVEISGYNTHYGENTYYHTGEGTRSGLYASIDQDSAPGNVPAPINPETDRFSSYEDDTAVAPTINMVLTEGERTITGTVFEDDTKLDESIHTGEQRKGDGKYTNSEDGTVKGVKVDLLVYDKDITSPTVNGGKGVEDFTDDKIARLYGYEEQNEANSYEKAQVVENGRVQDSKTYVAYSRVASMITGEDGYYKFVGLIPNEYILRFTYADGNVVYKNGSATSEEGIDATYYKATIITSQAIKEGLNNNKIVGDGSTADGRTIANTNYASNKWHRIYEDARYSDAMDTNETVQKSISYYDINQGGYNGSDIYTGDNLTSKEAFTGVINVQVEYSADDTYNPGKDTTTSTTLKETPAGEGETTILEIVNSDGTRKYLTEYLEYTCPDVDFGIVRKAKQDYDISKEVLNVKIILANGQILIDGNPAKDVMKYTKYLPEETKRKRVVNLEMDNEIIHGSTLEVTYKVTATNLSELSYATEEYYRYGTEGTEDEIESIKMTKIVDYLDDDLVFDTETRDYTDNNKIEAITRDDRKEEVLNSEDKKYLIDGLYDKIKSYKTILILSGTKDLIPIEEDDKNKESWTYIASEVLTTTLDDFNFKNDIEGIETTTTPAPAEPPTPGNNDPTDPDPDPDPIKPKDPDSYETEIIITNPTGEDKSYTEYIVGAVMLVVLAGGIIIIKRKVL